MHLFLVADILADIISEVSTTNVQQCATEIVPVLPTSSPLLTRTIFRPAFLVQVMQIRFGIRQRSDHCSA